MHQLQQLDREFDIAQASWTELHLAFYLVRRNSVGDPLSHSLHLLDKAGTP